MHLSFWFSYRTSGQRTSELAKRLQCRFCRLLDAPDSAKFRGAYYSSGVQSSPWQTAVFDDGVLAEPSKRCICDHMIDQAPKNNGNWAWAVNGNGAIDS